MEPNNNSKLPRILTAANISVNNYSCALQRNENHISKGAGPHILVWGGQVVVEREGITSDISSLGDKSLMELIPHPHVTKPFFTSLAWSRAIEVRCQ